MWTGHLQKGLAVFQDECTVHFNIRILYFHMRITCVHMWLAFSHVDQNFHLQSINQLSDCIMYHQGYLCVCHKKWPLCLHLVNILSIILFLNQYIWDSTIISNQIYKTWSYSNITPARRPLFVFHWQHKLLLSIAAVALPSRETVLMCQNWSAADPSFHKSNNSCFLTAMRPTN